MSPWPGPCPSPRRPHGSASTASSRQPLYDPSVTLPHLSLCRDSFPTLPHCPLWALLAMQTLVGTEKRTAWQETGCAVAQVPKEPRPAGPKSQYEREQSRAERSQEPRPLQEEWGTCLQAFVHTSFSHQILTVAPFTDGKTEAQGQEGPAQVPQLVGGRPGAPLPTHGAGLPASSRVTVSPAPCLRPSYSVAPSAVEGRHSSWSKGLIQRASFHGLSPREDASSTPQP